MRRFQQPGGGEVPTSALSKGERRRLLTMVVGLVFVVVALVTSLYKARQLADEEGGDVPFEMPQMTTKVVVPDVDGEALAKLVSDSESRARVVLEPEALALVFAEARRSTPAGFAALEPRELDAGSVAELSAAPDGHRGEAFVVRGRIESMRSRRSGPTAPEEHICRLSLDDGAQAYVVVRRVPETGGAVRVDGFFVKLFADESDVSPGTWIEGPLFVGREAVRSFADQGPVEELDRELLAAVQDDELLIADGGQPRISGLPFRPLWHLMGHAASRAAAERDWRAAPELDGEAVARLVHDGESFRGSAFRIPISRLQGVRIRAAGENPARIEEFTEGWIGNSTWKNVVHFQAPTVEPDLRLRQFVTARGFFLKNFAYESAGRGLRVAPMFVLHSIDRFVPPDNPGIRQIVYGIVVGTIVLIVVFVVLLRRDRRRSRELHDEIVRRRQARRARSAGSTS